MVRELVYISRSSVKELRFFKIAPSLFKFRERVHRWKLALKQTSFWYAQLSVRLKQYTSRHVMVFNSPSRHRFGMRSGYTDSALNRYRTGTRHELCGERSTMRWSNGYGLEQFVYRCRWTEGNISVRKLGILPAVLESRSSSSGNGYREKSENKRRVS